MLNVKSSSIRVLRLALIALITAAPLAWFAWTAYAATRMWTGASGTDSNWMTAANWGGTAPTALDALVFPDGAGVARKTNTNNYTAGTAFDSITFQGAGFTLNGNSITLNSGITDTGVAGTDNIVSIPLTLLAPQTFSSAATGRQLRIQGNVNTNAHTLTLGGTGNITTTNVLSGTGGLTKTGTGTATLGGLFSQTYTGQTSVNQGTLVLGKGIANNSVSGTLVVGDATGTANTATARLASASQVPDAGSVTVNSDGLFDLNGLNEGFGALTVNAGNVTIGTSTLTVTGLTMTGGNISSTGAGKLLLGGNLTTFASASPATISGYIDLGGGTRTFTVDDGGASDDLNITAVIGNGGLTKAGTGLLALRGNNTYAATTTISAGRLEIRGDQPQTSVTVNGGTLAGTGTVGPVNATSGFVKPNLGGASFKILTVQGNLSLSSATTYVPVISFCPVGTTPNGIVNVVGTVNLGGSNIGLDVACGPPNFLPEQTYVVVSNDGTDAVTGQFAGLAEGAPLGVYGLHITYKGGDGGNDVVLYTPTLTRVWTGGGADNKWSTQANWEGGVVPRAGDSLEFPSAGAQKTNVNDLPAGLALNAINFSASGYAVSGNSVSLGGGLTASANAQVSLTRITLTATQTFSGSLAVASEVDVNGKLLFIDAVVTISGAISGAGEIRRTGGVGTATLSGNNHNFTGATTIDFDTLAINGLHDQSPVTLSNIGRLAGSGTTGPVTATGASIRPSGILSVNGNLSLRRNANNGTGTLTININGTTPGSGYDQLNVTGAVNLNNNGSSPYSLTVTGAITPGAQYVIINNDGADAVTGTFSGKSQNSTFKLGNRDVSISYTGNDGNDVVLTAVPMTFQWDGGSTVNSNWMTKENWVGDVAPLPGDNLEFPDAADRKSNTNDFPAGTAFRSITLSGAGYTLGVNGLSLTAGLTDTGAAGADNTITLPVTLAAPQTFASNAAGRQLILQGNVVVNEHQLTLGGTGGMKLSGIVLTLVGGSVVKTGTGTAEIAGAGGNNIVGVATVSEGTLVLNKTAGSFAVHDLTVGDGTGAPGSAVARLMQSNQISDVSQVTVNADGRFDLNGFTEAVAPLRVNDGNVTIGTGTLTTSGLTMTDGAVSSTGAGKLVLNGNVTANAAPTAATISGNLDLNGATRTFNVAFTEDGGLSVSALISNGGLTKAGAGTLILSANNTYSGTTAISAGTLQVNGGQLQSPVTVNGGALAGHGTVGPITTTVGSVRPAGADGSSLALQALNVQGNVSFSSTTTYSPLIRRVEVFDFVGMQVSRLDVVGSVTLSGANLAPDFSGIPSFCCTYVLIANDGTDAVTGTFNGLPEGSLLSYHDQFLRLSYRGGDGNDVILHVPTTRTWDGQKDDGTPSADANWMTKENWVGDIAPQVGDSLVFPETAQLKTNTNNFPANTIFSALMLSGGGYTIGGNALNVVNGVTDSHASGANTFSLAIGGTGGLTKNGAGTLILSASNTYSGTTAISAGTLQVNGGQLQSPVTVSGGALVGHGTVGPITATGGSVRPQDNGSEALNVNGNVSFSSATTYSPTIRGVQSLGFFGTVVNILDVVGTVTLNGANFAPEFSGTPSFSGISCCTYVLIANDGTDAVTGTFNGLPEGSLLSYHGQFLRLSYRGDTGNNDVTLTVADRPTISIDDVSVNEGNSGQTNATLTVRLSEAVSNAPATVAYATADGTATAGSDYVSTSGTLTFNPGETSKTVTVLINGDTVNEADETFFVNLSNPTLATIADGQGQATIRNDDASTPNLAVVQFATSSYIADEAARFISVTVTRSVETSSAVTVNYETSDVTATERADYTMALGTLRFAAGETQKSLDLLITDDGRSEGGESFNITLSNPSAGAALGSQSTATLTITDNDATDSAANPVDSSAFFVRQHYLDFLNREPDQSGLEFWTNQITQCGGDAHCTEVRRINVSAAFFLSIEFQETGYLVYRLHQASTGAGPLLKKRDFVFDTQEIGRGVVVGAPGWEAQLEANKQAFVAGFVTRQDFLSLYPPGMTAAEFIDKLNFNTGTSLTQPERDDLVARLNAGTITRAQAIRAVAENANFNRREFNPAFVYMQYVGYLRRNPNDTPDTNLEGYNFWLGKLYQFNGNFVEAEMVKAFLVSSEYRSRFGL